MTANEAIDPSVSATVSASAGTGKTWSLVSRIVRLLIDGAEPGNILAITFTRKAAAEMQARLNDRLLELASCTADELKQNLELIGAPVTENTLLEARQLYERILYSIHPPRITTFHAMCQELLKRFPFDSNVPPGFELTEQTSDLQSEAKDLLFNQATLDNNGDIAQALETLFFYCGGLDNTRLVLDNFLNHRSDWWAFTLHQSNPVAFARDQLQTLLGLESFDNPLDSFFTDRLSKELAEFAELLIKNSTPTNQGFYDAIQLILQQIEQQDFARAYSILVPVFLTDKGEGRKRKSSVKQGKLMGETGEQRFLELHEYFVVQITELNDKQARLNNYELSSAWFTAGHQLLEHYQTIKKEQRVLDFADLEWNAFLLLSDENHATWIQYKLDARIDHVLIDEYQDTNPTQWHFLKPLLEEISCSEDDRRRSAFIVGDTKQSIYRFRRAQPRLFEIARQWLNQHMNCVDSSLKLSRRSSPAIINFVNTVFKDGPLREHIIDFEEHSTHLQNMWGKVVVPPLFTNDEADEIELTETGDTAMAYRNPLLAPLITQEDKRRVNEARFIANEIARLITNRTVIGSSGNERYLNYSDIVILLGQRTHAAIYQKELNASSIPYIGINKGTLLETLEIRDMSALLNILVTPFDNLALAQVLKSPIFDCKEQELIALASLKKGSWFERLQLLAEKNPDTPSITRAVRLLSSWKKDVGILPVHDLLDKIISESNLINRYVAAYPDHLKHSVESNLNRFIELALEIESGRYPSISRFLQRLSSLRDNQKDAPDELPAGKSTDRVRLLTIHAAKGLEAPVIFLADANNTPQNRQAYHAIVDWPADADKPACFLLSPRKEDQSQIVRNIFTAQENDIQREQANLLYVALTRARQLLYVTGSQARKGASGIKAYDLIRSQLETHSEVIEATEDGTLVMSSHQMPTVSPAKTENKEQVLIDIDSELAKPFTKPVSALRITPSSLTLPDDATEKTSRSPEESETLRQRGIVIHKILQLLTQSKDRENLKLQLGKMYQGTLNEEQLNLYWNEAESLFDSENLGYLFDSAHFEKAMNEVPVQYRYNNHEAFGIIDRLVVSGDKVFIVDYKTARISKEAITEDQSRQYAKQMSVYHHGIQRLWPDKIVRSQILFTYSRAVVDVAPLAPEELLPEPAATVIPG